MKSKTLTEALSRFSSSNEWSTREKNEPLRLSLEKTEKGFVLHPYDVKNHGNFGTVLSYDFSLGNGCAVYRSYDSESMMSFYAVKVRQYIKNRDTNSNLVLFLGTESEWKDKWDELVGRAFIWATDDNI